MRHKVELSITLTKEDARRLFPLVTWSAFIGGLLAEKDRLRDHDNVPVLRSELEEVCAQFASALDDFLS